MIYTLLRGVDIGASIYAEKPRTYSFERMSGLGSGFLLKGQLQEELLITMFERSILSLILSWS